MIHTMDDPPLVRVTSDECGGFEFSARRLRDGRVNVTLEAGEGGINMLLSTGEVAAVKAVFG